MGLKMIVMVKQVPDTHNITGDAMKADGTVNRARLPAIINPEDLNALEEAIKIKEADGGHITAVTMGPSKAIQALKECLYRGADDVILVSDRKFAGADTLATAYTLKHAVEKIGTFDLILCGRQAIDGDTAQVGPQIAEKLGINQITGLVQILAIDEQSATIRRLTDDGYEVVRAKLPLLVTVTSDANQPRSPSAKLVMAYKNVDRQVDDESYDEAYMSDGDSHLTGSVAEWNADSIGIDPSLCGLAGSPTKVKKIDNVVLAASEMKVIPSTRAGIEELMHELMDEHIV